jgi:formiminotetrahydrofolate cyclodeaminase
MTTKLTLTVEKSTIEKAKSYAKQTGRSLSELVEKYAETITDDKELIISSKLKGIIGAVKLPSNFDEKNEMRKYFEEKHL